MTKARDLANASTALSAVSATELGYVDGVTSAIQTQLDAKAPSSTAVTLTGTQTLTNKTLTSPVISSVINNTLTSTTGDIIYASAANTPARLGIGSSAQVLTVASGVPSWATPSAGTPTFSGCAIYQTAGQSINNSTQTDLTFDVELFDTDAFHSTATNTNRITIPTGKAGYYLVIARISYASNATGTRGLWLLKNAGTYLGSYFSQPVATSDITTIQIVQIANLSVADYITMNAYQSSGGALSTAVDQGKTYFSVQYLGA